MLLIPEKQELLWHYLRDSQEIESFKFDGTNTQVIRQRKITTHLKDSGTQAEPSEPVALSESERVEEAEINVKNCNKQKWELFSSR